VSEDRVQRRIYGLKREVVVVVVVVGGWRRL